MACSVLGAQLYMAKLTVKMDKKSPINCLDQHTKTLSFSFTKRVQPVCVKDVLEKFKFENLDDFKPFLGTLFAYCGDFHLACKVQPFSPYLLHLLYSAFKVAVASIERLKEVLKDFELKTVSDVTLI